MRFDRYESSSLAGTDIPSHKRELHFYYLIACSPLFIKHRCDKQLASAAESRADTTYNTSVRESSFLSPPITKSWLPKKDDHCHEGEADSERKNIILQQIEVLAQRWPSSFLLFRLLAGMIIANFVSGGRNGDWWEIKIQLAL